MSTWFSTYGFEQVHPNLFVGAYPLDRDDVDALDRLRVDRVLNLVQDSEYRPGERREIELAYGRRLIMERRMDLVDFGHLPEERLDKAVDVVLRWLRDEHRVYVHCRAGWQRSAAVAAGSVALLESLSIDDALDAVQQRKPSANPLPHQRTDLLSWWLSRRAKAERAASRRA